MIRKSGVYIGWLGCSNLGDELMFELCRKQFQGFSWYPADVVERKVGAKEVSAFLERSRGSLGSALMRELRTLSHSRSALQRFSKRIESMIGEGAILGGGTIINLTNPMFEQYRGLRRKLGRPVPVFGAGVADPTFWSHRPRYRDRLKEWVAEMADLPLVGVRGPDSKALLESAGARNVVISGDPVVLLHEAIAPDTKRKESLRIGINCGVAATGAWRDAAEFSVEMGRAGALLHRSGYKIDFFAVAPEDLAACRSARDTSGVADANITLLDPRNAARHISQYDLILALKLHSAIVAASCNVPFVMLDYRPKCRDFTRSIGWEEFRLRIDEVGPAEIVATVHRLAANADTYRTHLCAAMCGMKSRFETYCTALEQLLLGRFDGSITSADFPDPVVSPAASSAQC